MNLLSSLYTKCRYLLFFKKQISFINLRYLIKRDAFPTYNQNVKVRKKALYTQDENLIPYSNRAESFNGMNFLHNSLFKVQLVIIRIRRKAQNKIITYWLEEVGTWTA